MYFRLGLYCLPTITTSSGFCRRASGICGKYALTRSTLYHNQIPTPTHLPTKSIKLAQTPPPPQSFYTPNLCPSFIYSCTNVNACTLTNIFFFSTNFTPFVIFNRHQEKEADRSAAFFEQKSFEFIDSTCIHKTHTY